MSGNWLRIKALFAEAAEIDPAIRDSWLAERCRDNPEVGREVASLLECDNSSDSFLEAPAWRFDGQSCIREDLEEEELKVRLPGTTIGSWHIIREISSGGMGTVYLAERTIDDDDRSLKQRAAIKIIRARVDAKLFARRFRRERRILAQLSHPFIARFLEGGTLENGLPYFALDYIEGEPIDDYCRNRRLDRAGILKLFCEVCTAVAYAHRNLVVHRDLKPSNILIAADGTPHLLDFGIAKLLVDEEDSMDQTRGLGPYTPRYSSPEQILGHPVTTASDIFALGIILYEIIAGTHPFDPAEESESAPAIDVLRRICEDEPKKLREHPPKGRGSAGRQDNARLLTGDMELIVSKALRKAPADRYKSVEYFIDDIQNLLVRRPILARSQTSWYRVRTLVRRHPTATLSSSIALVVGIIALGFILISDHTARRERDYALQQRELAASSARTMINDLASALESMSAPIERRLELLQQVAGVFDEIDATSRSGMDPAGSAVQIRAEVQTQLVLARALEELGDIQGAIRRSERAELQARKLASLQPSNPDDQVILAKALLERSRAFRGAGEMITAAEVLEELLRKLHEIEDLDRLMADARGELRVLFCDALLLKVSLIDRLAQPANALKLFSEALRYAEQAYQTQPSNREAMDSLANGLERLGAFYYDSGRIDLFAEPIKRALTLRCKAAAEVPADVGLQRRAERATAQWGGFLLLADAQNEKVVLPGESLVTLRRLYAADPNNAYLMEDLVRQLGTYGVYLFSRNDYEDAKKFLAEATDIGKRLVNQKKSGFYIRDCLTPVVFGLSVSYSRTGDVEAGRKINGELLTPLTQQLEASDPDKANNRFREALSCYAQAEVEVGAGRWERAAEMFSQSLSRLEENSRTRDYPCEGEMYGDCMARFGNALGHTGNTESGCRHIERGLQILYAARDSGRAVPRSAILNDIADAEKALRRYQQKPQSADRSPSSVEH